MNAEETGTGKMHRRREKMADNRRYIIYYTFKTRENSETQSWPEPDSVTPTATEEGENV